MLQRTFRGHLGRRRANLVGELAAAQAQAQGSWVEVRDAENGDVWYFNQATGESQWQLPAAFEELIPAPSRVLALPSLSPRRGTCARELSQSMTALSLPAVKLEEVRRPHSAEAAAAIALPGIKGKELTTLIL